MNDLQLLRYSRHLLLPAWTEQAQQRLSVATVLIVGAGGLGSAAAMYLAASGLGRLVVMDDDRLELSNLQRQVCYRTAWLGDFKVEALQRAVADLNPEVQVRALAIKAQDDNLLEQVRQADVVLDCTDHWASRQLINRVCVAARKPLVFGAAVQQSGQLAVFDVRDPLCPCYACVFPALDQPSEASCALMGVFAPLPGMIGSAQAGEALKLITQTGTPLKGRLILVDSERLAWSEMTVPRLPTCSVCGSR